MDQSEAKAKIQAVIINYTALFPQEFADFKKGMAVKRDQQRTKFAEVKGTDYLERKLFEVPATLWDSLKNQLTKEEMEFFRSKPGARWFAKTFKAFSIAEKV